MKTPRSYFVSWEIEVDAETPQEAAQFARYLQDDPNTTATVFRVWDEAGNETTVDTAEVTK